MPIMLRLQDAILLTKVIIFYGKWENNSRFLRVEISTFLTARVFPSATPPMCVGAFACHVPRNLNPAFVTEIIFVFHDKFRENIQQCKQKEIPFSYVIFHKSLQFLPSSSTAGLTEPLAISVL